VRDPADLYELRSDMPELAAPVMLVSLDGFVDAGGAARQAVAHLFDGAEYEVLATFDVDGLLDYRSRRPTMTFADREWTSYAEPELAVYLMRDVEQAPYLLLTGPEPDREWEAFVAAVQDIATRLQVRLGVGFHGVPMAVPHTRPTTVTAHATRNELVGDHTPWIGKLQVPGSAAALLEYRMGRAGGDFIGYAVHVPSYLAQSEYPWAAIRALECVEEATGLSLDPRGLEEEAERTDREIARQVADSEEVQRVVAELEEQYDEYLAARENLRGDGGDLDAGALYSEEGQLPTAEELGDVFERFLAERDGKDEG
jgi:hypothetical protein